MDRTQKANKNWESYSEDEDMDSLEDDLDTSQDSSPLKSRLLPGGAVAMSSSGAPFKRAMAEDKLQEKRLKERARRNGMASSIDEMRVLVPELIEAKKNYSQAKVVAFALAHIYELQRENDDFRDRLGLPSRMDEFRTRAKSGSKNKKERLPAGERGRKRRRLLNGGAVVTSDEGPTPQSEQVAIPATEAYHANDDSSSSSGGVTSTEMSRRLSVITTSSSSLNYTSPEVSDHDVDMDSFVVDSLAASPALSPHAIDDELGPFGLRNFDNFDSHPRPHAMDWEGHDSDMDMFNHQHQHQHHHHHHHHHHEQQLQQHDY
jgi:hypothetical protein